MHNKENKVAHGVIYIAEPDAIDLSIVAKVLEGSGVDFVAGSTDFSSSTAQDYDTLLIRSATKVDSSIKSYFPGLKNIVRAGVGMNNIDLEYCKSSGITVYNAPGANADAVSEYIVAVALYALRRLDRLDDQHVRDWDRFAFRGRSINEHTIGIIGFGHIGKLLYDKLNIFSAPEFLVFDPYISSESIRADNIQLASLEDVLKRATLVSLNLPLTPETTHLINAQRLELMQDGSVLINAARGGIVDEVAVAARTKRGNFTYIADCVEGEPIVNEQLLGNSNIIITPHIAALTTSSEQEMVRQAIHNFLKGVPANVFG